MQETFALSSKSNHGMNLCRELICGFKSSCVVAFRDQENLSLGAVANWQVQRFLSSIPKGRQTLRAHLPGTLNFRICAWIAQQDFQFQLCIWIWWFRVNSSNFLVTCLYFSYPAVANRKGSFISCAIFQWDFEYFLAKKPTKLHILSFSCLRGTPRHSCMPDQECSACNKPSFRSSKLPIELSA